MDFNHNNIILQGVTGSHATGTATPESDTDHMGIFVETKAQVMGLDRMDNYIQRNRADGERSQAGDEEFTMYSLRKFTHLSLNGNPTVMELLFLPHYEVQTKVGLMLTTLRNHFVSYDAGHRYLGYLIAQKQKMKGERAHTVNRTDLKEKYGYDTKFAAHAIRLGLQGIEFLQTRGIRLPSPHAPELRKIRSGGYTEAEVLERIEELEARLRVWVEANKGLDLSQERSFASKLLVKLHEQHWIDNAQWA